MKLEQRIVLLAQAIGTDVKSLRSTIGSLAGLTTTSKSSVIDALNEVLAKANGNAAAIGTLASLTTTAKGSLVAALNEVKAQVEAIDLTVLIDDAAASTVTNKTFSVAKIHSVVEVAVNKLVDSSPAALDTLRELATALGDDANFATTVASSLGQRVRVDAAQAFTAGEQGQARGNISAASIATVTAAQAAADVAKSAADAAQGSADAISLALGNLDHDFGAVYASALV